MAETKCPCGLGASYEACCGRYVESGQKAPTAEALMRSRYAAFTKKRVEYIVATHHSRTKSSISAEAIQGWCDRAEWLDFVLEETSGGGEGEEKGRVRFLARYKEKGVIVNHHEDAYFEKEGGEWRFVDGGTPPVRRATPKVGRNDPCTCGSGKKWKKCCGAASAA